MAYNTVTVTSTATKIVDATANRQSLVISNNSSVTIYIGEDDSVTTSNGINIVAGGNISYDNSGGRMWKGPIYGIVSTATANVRYWEVRSN